MKKQSLSILGDKENYKKVDLVHLVNITKNTVNDTGAIFINGGRLIAGGKIIVENNTTSVNSVQKNMLQ